MTFCKVKIIVGFRRDQEHSIEGDEVHKAYYLFLHPEERGIFRNGLAIVGAQIQEIIPDWQATMGWNPTHNLTSDDWNEIRSRGIERKMNAMLEAGRHIGANGDPSDMQQTLTELVVQKYPALMPSRPQERTGRVQSIGQLAASRLQLGQGKNMKRQSRKS